MGRRAKGDGSITLRRDGRWEGAVYVPTILGASKKRVRVYAKTREEVRDKLTEKMELVRRGALEPDHPWTVGEYLDLWLATVVPTRNRPNTARGYETMVRLHIAPRLGKKPLSKLTTRDVQHAVDALVRDGHSARTAQKFRAVLSIALNRAAREDLVFRNVATLIDLPSYRRKPIDPWSLDDAATFLRSVEHHPWHIAYLLLLTYGLRAGEVVGLRWEDVDFSRNEIRVRQQVQRLHGHLQATPVKTDAGQRTLPMVAEIRSALLRQAEQNGVDLAHDHRSSTPEFSTERLVVTSRTGGPVEPRGLLRTFDLLTQQAGLRRLTLHQTRHTVATLLDSFGVAPRDVQLILGHAHVSTTQQIYQHGNLTQRRAAIGTLAEAFSAVDAGGVAGAPPLHNREQDSSLSRQIEPSNEHHGDDSEPPPAPTTGVEPSTLASNLDSPDVQSRPLLSFWPLVRFQPGVPQFDDSTPVTEPPLAFPDSYLEALLRRTTLHIIGLLAVSRSRQLHPRKSPQISHFEHRARLRSELVTRRHRQPFPLSLSQEPPSHIDLEAQR